MRHVLLSLALLAGVSTSSLAQDARPTVLVYPFGMSTTARGAMLDVAGMLATRAIQGVQATNRFTAINESANPAIRSQLESATTLSQFESAVQLRGDRQLQSKYMLTGFVENIEMKPEPGPNNSTRYRAVVTAIVSVYDVETRAVLQTTSMRLASGMIAGALSGVDPCAGKKGLGLMGCRAKETVKEKGTIIADSALNKQTGVGDDTPAKALESALASAAGNVSEFLNKVIK